MNRDGDDAWDPYLGDHFDSVNREGWDEDDWEGFLCRQDFLATKYQELYETLRDHPDRDELIARELRWNFPEDLSSEYGDPPEEADEDLDGPDFEDSEESFTDSLGAIAAFRRGQAFALAVERQLTARLRDGLADDEDAARAVQAAVDVTSHIANGHGIGYERDTLCGNIACCTRALRSLAECFDSLLTLRRRGILPPLEADRLLREGRAAGDAVAERTEELRSRVWWR